MTARWLRHLLGMSMRSSSALVLAALFTGCPAPSTGDAGVAEDAGARRDAGQPGSDGGASSNDAGAAHEDAGVVPTDAGADDDAGDEDDAGDLAPPDCSAPVGGIDLDGVTDADSAYDSLVAELESVELPASVSFAGANPLSRGVVAYMLELSPGELGQSLPTADVLARGPLGTAVVVAYVAGGEQDFDFTVLRQGLYRYYTCSKGFPATLEGFKSTFADFSTSASVLIETSVPKNAPRRLYELPEVGVYVAETLENDLVRETEIVLEGYRDDDALDFLVYGADGSLRDGSHFAGSNGNSIVGASPYTCMSCHVTFGSVPVFDVVFPDGP